MAARLVVPLLLAGLWSTGCGKSDRIRQTGGDPERGRDLLVQYNCGACHVIPDVTGAQGRLGPALKGLSRRDRLRGELPNTPENVIRWIAEPQSIRPTTAMPRLVRREQDAKDLAAALYDAESLFD